MSAEPSAPNQVALGWIEHGTRKDAIEYAKGYATRHFDAPAICWYAVLPVLGGWLFEVQEGGPGRSHLTAVAKALAEGADLAWFRVGRKAYTVSMRDGRPFCVLLPETDSQEILASETGKLQAKGKMERVIKRGTTVLAVGLTVFGIGALFLAGAQTFHAMSQRFIPEDRVVNPDVLPHRQWSRVDSIPPNLFVESLRIDPDGEQWQAVVKPIQAPRQIDTPAPITGEEGTPTDAVPVDPVILPGQDTPPPLPDMTTDMPSLPVPPETPPEVVPPAEDPPPPPPDEPPTDLTPPAPIAPEMN